MIHLTPSSAADHASDVRAEERATERQAVERRTVERPAAKYPATRRAAAVGVGPFAGYLAAGRRAAAPGAVGTSGTSTTSAAAFGTASSPATEQRTAETRTTLLRRAVGRDGLHGADRAASGRADGSARTSAVSEQPASPGPRLGPNTTRSQHARPAAADDSDPSQHGSSGMADADVAPIETGHGDTVHERGASDDASDRRERERTTTAPVDAPMPVPGVTVRADAASTPSASGPFLPPAVIDRLVAHAHGRLGPAGMELVFGLPHRTLGGAEIRLRRADGGAIDLTVRSEAFGRFGASELRALVAELRDHGIRVQNATIERR